MNRFRSITLPADRAGGLSRYLSHSRSSRATPTWTGLGVQLGYRAFVYRPFSTLMITLINFCFVRLNKKKNGIRMHTKTECLKSTKKKKTTLTKHINTACEGREDPRVPALVALIHEGIDGRACYKEEENIRKILHCNIIILFCSVPCI